ncbi:beta-propeller domain-containing protein [bacterium]|nr:beta-propeller domain-containing protein [bacterium]
MKKEIDSKIAIGIIIIVAFLVGAYLILECRSFPGSLFSCVIEKTKIPVVKVLPKKPHSKIKGVKSFSSEEEFKSYLQEAEISSFQYLGLGAVRSIAEEKEILSMPLEIGAEGSFGGEEPERVSETNVQVAGIDEPDIVKTDGKEIYFSSAREYWRWGWGEEMRIPYWIKGITKVIKAFPPTDLKIEEEIDKIGNLLLSDNILMIFSGDKIYGYDVSNPKSPEKKWVIEIEKRNFITGARLYNGKLYLVTKTTINTFRPCPIKPLVIEGAPLEVKCTDIYHPIRPVPVDVTYTAMIVDPRSGKIEKKISFVGSSDSSVVYMSTKGIYVTYSYWGDLIEFFANFFNQECQDIIPDWFISKLNKLSEYDISKAAKMTEFQVLIEKYFSSLSDDERLRIENELTNRLSDYYKKHKRDLERTGIVKIGLKDFEIYASGDVPGKPLNQFSLDEYQNHLRIAITVGERFFGMGSIGISSRESANDVYVLDKDLKIVGSVKDLGLRERIYSVRFVEDKGYVVTFRRIDPFYVLDLSDPQKPELKGELKIPGFSSYLHPITKERVLGIGKEGSKVKISLFDVSSPDDPSEADKYILDEYWSDILNTHHAFLLDKKHKIFFMPGSKGGYVFSYNNDELKLQKAVSGIRARRAIYINDYLYIIGDNKITVLNEIDWEKVNELEF